MKPFVIVTDSCSDLPKELRDRFNIDYLYMHFIYDGNDVLASLDWEFVPVKDFYNLMRNGTRITTAQVTTPDYLEAFEKYVKNGFDVLSISCSSALSGSYKASTIAREEVLKKYPDAKIICIDSLNSCMGLGSMCINASIMREEGKPIEEVAAYIEENKLYYHQIATVDDLAYLKRAGRVSATSAFFGSILKIKPIVISDAIGQNFASEKVKGRKASI
ncbi:MAG: DegV family protein, partial [Clostridia bacterium]|nr:DegV family protein [Clostridia bacterium]